MIKTKSAKAKARNLQKYIVQRILHHFPQLKEGDATSCSMGAPGVDIQMSPLARKVLPLSIEAKKTKKTPNRSELEQSKNNAYPMTTPCVVWCPHGKGLDKSTIIFDLEDFFNLYKGVIQVAFQLGEEYANKEKQDN